MVDIRSIVFMTTIFSGSRTEKKTLKSFSARVARLQCFSNGAMHLASKKSLAED